MSKLLKQVILVCVSLFTLTGQVLADSQINAITDIVLMCEETGERDLVLEKHMSNAIQKNIPLSKDDGLLLEMNRKRNENIKRPFITIKYLSGKLSFNNNGVSLFENVTPEVTNSSGLVSHLLIQEDTIFIDYEWISGVRAGVRETINIDRYTGLYKRSTYEGDELKYESNGKCNKYSEKLF